MPFRLEAKEKGGRCEVSNLCCARRIGDGALAGSALGYANAESPLTVVVAYSAGGSTDTIARVFAVRLQDKLGRPVVVEDKPGATGQIGSRYVAKAAPDGNTIQVAAQTTHAVAPSLYGKSIGYDPLKDFTPIIQIAWTPLVLVTNPKFPPTTVKELIEYLKGKPGQVSYATGGRGDGSHLSALLFHRLAGVEAGRRPLQRRRSGDAAAAWQPRLLHVPGRARRGTSHCLRRPEGTCRDQQEPKHASAERPDHSGVRHARL